MRFAQKRENQRNVQVKDGLVLLQIAICDLMKLKHFSWHIVSDQMVWILTIQFPDSIFGIYFICLSILPCFWKLLVGLGDAFAVRFFAAKSEKKTTNREREHVGTSEAVNWAALWVRIDQSHLKPQRKKRMPASNFLQIIF